MSLWEITTADAASEAPLPKVRVVLLPLAGTDDHPVPELQVLLPDAEVDICARANGLAAMASNTADVREGRENCRAGVGFMG